MDTDNIKEMTENELENLIAKLPLPTFKDASDERLAAMDYFRTCAYAVAAIATGASSRTVKQMWKLQRTAVLESRRFHLAVDASGARWDAARGKYLVFYPSALATPSRRK